MQVQEITGDFYEIEKILKLLDIETDIKQIKVSKINVNNGFAIDTETLAFNIFNMTIFEDEEGD